jgi:uncharacterized membrane protein
VKVLLIIVQFVPMEEPTHQNVLAQMDNTKTLTSNVRTVLQNVKLAPLMMSVLNVLTTLTEMVQLIVFVLMVSMMIVLISVHLVTLNVLLVLLMNIVLLVVQTEKAQKIVHVSTIITTLLIGFVTFVNTNVMDVSIVLPTVLLVPKTESKTQPVTVQVDTITLTNKKCAQNVTVSVTLVNNLVLA